MWKFAGKNNKWANNHVQLYSSQDIYYRARHEENPERDKGPIKKIAISTILTLIKSLFQKKLNYTVYEFVFRRSHSMATLTSPPAASKALMLAAWSINPISSSVWSCVLKRVSGGSDGWVVVICDALSVLNLKN
jgi:hypothetical protein